MYHYYNYIPAYPWYVLRTIFNVNVDTIEAKNIRHVKLWFQKLAPSSKLNKTPPIDDVKNRMIERIAYLFILHT